VPAVLAIQKAKIRRIAVQSQPRPIVLRDPISKKKKNSSQKKPGGVAQGVGPEFKPQCHKNKTKQTNH
jgi:hypothetical protein